MHTLTLRIYVTVVAVLLLFASASAWLFQRQIDRERMRTESAVSERMSAWGELMQRSLPPADAPVGVQAESLSEWSERLRIPLALETESGQRIATSESFAKRVAEGHARTVTVKLDDGRHLIIARGLRASPPRGPNGPGLRSVVDLPFVPPGWPPGLGFALLLVALFVAVAAGAWPVVNRLTRRLQSLKRGVEAFGAGDLSHRVDINGRDEVTALAASFNASAARIEALVRSHQSLLANASHELRSPLARMKMAVSMLEDAPTASRDKLRREIDTNIAELDALVEEVLLASRLDALKELEQKGRVDLLGLAAEEAARVNATASGESVSVVGDERLLRRALRNLLENARRYGGEGDIEVNIVRNANHALVRVLDRGPGVPTEQATRIFEPFYRMPGHAEVRGGVGLGLSLVRQIAERHGGTVSVRSREGGGCCFEIRLPGAQ